jgi:hypothetical protein
VQVGADFAGIGVVLHLALKSKPPDFFAKIIFGSAIYHFFTKQVGKKQESAPPGREREFSGVVISCGSQIGCN